jgi:hypothetical protein
VLQTDYDALNEKRNQLATVRTDLNSHIAFIEGQNPEAGRELRALAAATWLAEDRRLAQAANQQPTYEPLQLGEGQSQSWPDVREVGIEALTREARVMQAVVDRVEDRIDVLIPAGGGRRRGAICNPVTGANCSRN